MNTYTEGISRVISDMEKQRVEQEKRNRDFLARLLATVIMWAMTLLILGTIFGIWVKLFWLGWVFA